MRWDFGGLAYISSLISFLPSPPQRIQSSESKREPNQHQPNASQPPPPLLLPFLHLPSSYDHSFIAAVVVEGNQQQQQQEEEEVEEEGMTVEAEAQFHVLAVDDSLIDRKLIERLLKTSSYQVTTVESGSKALELLGFREDQSSTPSVSPNQHEIEVNLVITDYCMPGMTGYDLLKKIKGSSSLKDIPVVIMSSENVPSRISRCLEGGAEEFFLKPVQLSDLKRLRPHILKGKSNCKGQKQQQQQPENNNNNGSSSSSSNCSNSQSNKRKAMDAMDEGLSPGRTRPRFSSDSLTVV